MNIAELQYLASQKRPVWGGHVERGEPPTDEMQADIDAGLIVRKGNGYVLGPEGERRLAMHRDYHSRECPTCGGKGRI